MALPLCRVQLKRERHDLGGCHRDHCSPGLPLGPQAERGFPSGPRQRPGGVPFFLRTSSKQVRLLARRAFLKLFAPWGALIQAKRAQLTEHSEYVQELNVLMERVQKVMTSGGPEAEINNLLDQITAMEEKILDVGRMLAFRGHAPEVQDQFLQAAEFEGEWIEWGGFRLRSWYKCHCGLVYSSKNWKRLHNDMHAKGQRYYCRGWKCNGKRWMHRFGQLVEFRMNDGSIHFSYAPMPPKDVED